MADSGRARRVCLVGAGFISNVHAEALKSLAIPVAAVVDPNAAARQKLAVKWKIPAHFASVEEAIAGDTFDRVHILVPPDLHENVATTLLQAGKAVFVEKPLATTTEDCNRLIAAAAGRPRLGVNQNFVFHPAFAKLHDAATSCALGKPCFVSLVYHAPLRQLAARQFGHWMFRQPRNILLEQAVHPLSQLLALCGGITRIESVGDASVEISPGVEFFPSFTASLAGQNMPASFRFAVGQDFPFWQVSVMCDDGVLVADILGNRFWTMKRTRWLDVADNLVSGHATAGAIARDSWKNFTGYALSTLKLSQRTDGFFLSMKASIQAFHDAIDREKAPLVDGAFGRRLIEICDEIAAQIMPKPAARAAPVVRPVERPDVAVLGGTGFIGTAVVSKLRASGLKVSVMARNLTNLPAIFYGEGVALHRGDIRNPADITSAIEGAAYVVNLAHGGGGGSWEDIRDAMLGGAENVATASNAAGVKRLIHVGSIASLYLGPQPGTVTGAMPPDPHAEKRAFYARAKALCDGRLMEMHREQRLPVCILRPGLVVGKGTSPFHSGLGFFNNDQHCIGWNAGRNPLPFVLVDDVADAIVLACRASGVEGKAYNIVGDVRPSAREYIAELGRISRRPLKFHGKSAYGLYSNELTKWIVKTIGGKKGPPPSLRDILSRGLKAQFDCSDAKKDLGWHPITDVAAFYEQAF